ncbi:MAG: 5'/3'-nucleotidase SurE [Microthrixaceae bacterium]
MRRSVNTILLVTLALAASTTGCGGDGNASGPTTLDAARTTTSTNTPARGLVVLVSNDDGVHAEGIDQLTRALSGRADVSRVVIVAPAENQSGKGDSTTPSPTATDTATAGGLAAVAVKGTPADSVVYGLDTVLAGTPPDLVMSGVNLGQNLGPVLSISGTVGAARAAARRGLPAVAISQGLPAGGTEIDYSAAVQAAMAWLDEHAGSLQKATVANINAPSCASGKVRGTVEEPPALSPTDRALVAGVDCTSSATGTDDVTSFNAGFIVVSDVGLG